MSQFKTPGVYIVEKSVLPESVSGVSTAVPAFIGYTEKAGVNGELYYKPTRITSLSDYVNLFGTTTEEISVDVRAGQIVVDIAEPEKLMLYGMQMFFANGGESCYIVALDEKDTATEGADKFKAAIDALELEDEPTLIVLVDGVKLPASDYYAVCQHVLAHCNKISNRFAIFDVIETDSSTRSDIDSFRDNIGNRYLQYSAAYYPYLKTALKYQYSDNSVTVTYLDGETEKTAALGDEAIRIERTALYNEIKKAIASQSVTLPPATAIAGIYASVDRERGVWKAPANVSLSSVIAPTRKLSEEENDYMNVDELSGKSVNAIRSFTGKGTLVWGARTLAGNSNEWRYVPVRRLFNFVEESIQKATSYAVFEPNNAMTWLKLKTTVESFLESIWRQGALAGDKAEDAFFVQVGLGTTMTSQDILEGRIIIRVGIAAVRPAEFIIIEFTHKLQEA